MGYGHDANCPDMMILSMNSGDGTSAWIKFFKDAGIPAGDAAQYSIIFTENRIQKNMLLDLNKEYLNDMGISRMGDVIAILRHAKNVSSMEARSRVLQESTDSLRSDSPVEVRTVSKATGAKQTSVAKTVAKASVAKATKTVNKMAAAKATLRAASAASTSAAGPSTSSATARDSPTPRRSTPASRLVGHYIGNDPEAHPMNSLTRKEKLSRDLACRLGPTPGTKAPVGAGDCDIQSRLGVKKIRKVNSDSLALSTSDDITDSSQVRFKVVGLSGSAADSTQGSVFSRLGAQAPALKRPAHSTSPDEGEELPYAGIFKSVPEKKPKLNPETTKVTIKTRRPTEGILAQETLTEKKGVMGRLGAQLAAVPVTKRKMIPTSTLPKPPVSARLRTETEVTSSTGSKSIFNRLGGKP